ncbi:MAG: glycosyltransferase family 2 protein [Candidatus Eremiobacteraeota bacterium]|nr:glycosyltransferase family 2 protein [Candidatus Eremiobacteraeota bacterium]
MSRLDVSVVVPAFNEGKTLPGVLAALEWGLAPLRSRYATELLVVDDGSSDETAAILQTFSHAAKERERVITHPVNRGLTEAMKTGARAARGDVTVFLDADLSYAPEIVERLVDALKSHGAAASLASPYMRGGRAANVPRERLIASRVANLLLAACVGFRLHTFTGMVRAYDTPTLKALVERPVRGEFNAWAVAELLAWGKPVVEIPAALVWPQGRTQAPSRMSAATLGSRTRLVIQTIGVLRAAARSGPNGRSRTNGTKVPSNGSPRL